MMTVADAMQGWFGGDKYEEGQSPKDKVMESKTRYRGHHTAGHKQVLI